MEQETTLGKNGALISPKEVRKLLGKASGALSDEYLMRTVWMMSNLADSLLSYYLVPQNMVKGVQ